MSLKTWNKKGVALYFVLAILFVVVIMANIILSFITSQSKLTTHQVKRIQAYYAGQGAIYFALEQLRINNASWVVDSGNPLKLRKICSSSYAAIDATCVSPNYTEPAFPPSVHYALLNLTWDNSNNRVIVNSTVNYTTAY